jgi:hypothetical protein
MLAGSRPSICAISLFVRASPRQMRKIRSRTVDASAFASSSVAGLRSVMGATL